MTALLLGIPINPHAWNGECASRKPHWYVRTFYRQSNESPLPARGSVLMKANTGWAHAGRDRSCDDRSWRQYLRVCSWQVGPCRRQLNKTASSFRIMALIALIAPLAPTMCGFQTIPEMGKH